MCRECEEWELLRGWAVVQHSCFGKLAISKHKPHSVARMSNRRRYRRTNHVTPWWAVVYGGMPVWGIAVSVAVILGIGVF